MARERDVSREGYGTNRLTKAQQRSALRIWQRNEGDGSPSYLAFRRRIKVSPLIGCAGVRLSYGLWLGIEPNGYTHS